MVASAEVRIVPVIPTATYNPLEVVVEEDSSFSLQEKMMKLKRSMERIMSICLTWVPISGLGKPRLYHDLGVFYKNRGFYLEGVLDIWMIVKLMTW